MTNCCSDDDSRDPPEAGSIEDLLQRAKAGDKVALDELFTRCRNYLEIGAAAQVETWAKAKFDASDVVQQTMLEAYRGFSRFEGKTTAEWLGWLKVILAHNTADLVRKYRQSEKRQVRREIPLHGPRDDSQAFGVREPSADQSTPSQHLMRRESELQVADALAQLNDEYREVIMLRNLQRLPFDEVAHRMGRSRPAVQMLWMRAIKKLQEKLNAGT